MSLKLRAALIFCMVAALFFGFLHLFVPNGNVYNFERLHIFLFNLVSGGTILIHFTEGRRRLSPRATWFMGLSLVYAVLAFKKIYLPAMVIAFILAGIVDSVRIRRFSFFPWNFFKARAPVAEKFHQAALLCLSMGLVISGLVILNNEYLRLIHLEKLKLDTFFLGFSFPLSLITMSVMFSLMKEDVGGMINYLKNLGFWNINLGVIIFFLFILMEMLIPQLVVTAILFFSVVMIFLLFKTLGIRVQQKYFLTSGIVFLLYTAVTGILYIVLEFNPAYTHEKMKVLLRMHSFASLYGWNLSGLAVICRKDEFPLVLHSTPLIVLHWITAILLAPLGTYYRPFAMLALMGYGVILYFIMFSQKGSRIKVRSEQ
jgi:hypothetical protein